MFLFYEDTTNTRSEQGSAFTSSSAAAPTHGSMAHTERDYAWSLVKTTTHPRKHAN